MKNNKFTNIHVSFEDNIFIINTKELLKDNIHNSNAISIKDILNKEICIDKINKNNKNNRNNFDEYFFIVNCKIVPDDYILFNNEILENNNCYDNCYDQCDNLYINCYKKQLGGEDADFFIDLILDIVFVTFMPITIPFRIIGMVFKTLITFIFWIIKFMIWLVMFLIWVFTDLLNPANFFADFFKSLMVIIVAFFGAIINIFTAILYTMLNTIGEWMQGFWGWDMSNLNKNDKNSKYFKSFDRTKGTKAYLSNTNTVPFSIVLGTVLCPPLGVFMDLGISGWFNILICALLTLLFYVPGLFYALLIVYS